MISELDYAANSGENLSEYVATHFEKIYEYFTHQQSSFLIAKRNDLRVFFRNNRQVIKSLDLSVRANSSFIVLLIGACEQLGLLSEFKYLYRFIEQSNFEPGRRIEASALFLIGIRNAEDYITIYDDMIENLIYAYREEEDNSKKVIATLVNYYMQIIHNFGQFNGAFVFRIQNKIQNSIESSSSCNLLNNSFLIEVLNINVHNFEKAYSEILQLTDQYLGKKEIFQPSDLSRFLIEENTDYVKELDSIEQNFLSIRDLSVKMYQQIDDDELFYSLERGVAVLTKTNQLLTYMNSYGKMHYNKLRSAFENISDKCLEDNIHIIDWGCGQGMASLVYLDYIKSHKMSKNIKQFTLIEPSLVALKRASLHIEKMSNSSNLCTINKDFDSLKNDMLNFNFTSVNVNLHLFSNILDIDNFSMEKLLKNIQHNFKGINYFICVSPYVTDLKTSRIDGFVGYFSKFDDFQLLYSIDNKKGEWKNNWSRVIRIFYVNI